MVSRRRRPDFLQPTWDWGLRFSRCRVFELRCPVTGDGVLVPACWAVVLRSCAESVLSITPARSTTSKRRRLWRFYLFSLSPCCLAQLDGVSEQIYAAMSSISGK